MLLCLLGIRKAPSIDDANARTAIKSYFISSVGRASIAIDLKSLKTIM